MVAQHLKEFAIWTVQKEKYKEMLREFHRDFSTVTGQKEGFFSGWVLC